jgi:curli biogenesis system outer membrane secretion channel CsgG
MASCPHIIPIYMRNLKSAVCLIMCLYVAGGCASVSKPRPPKTGGLAHGAPTEIAVSKARIALADFEVHAAKASSDVGTGLRDLLRAALGENNKYIIVERQELQHSEQPAQQEQSNKTAGLIITADVVDFEPQSSGGKDGVGGGGGIGSGMMGGLLGAALNKANIAINLRIIDVSSSEVISSTRIEGQAVDTTGTLMETSPGRSELSAGLSAYAHTPMEKAIRICIIETVRYISQAIPVDYYRYEGK